MLQKIETFSKTLSTHYSLPSQVLSLFGLHALDGQARIRQLWVLGPRGPLPLKLEPLLLFLAHVRVAVKQRSNVSLGWMIRVGREGG